MRLGHALLVILLFGGLGLLSCGKKGDPFLSAETPVSRVTGLEGVWSGEDVLLTGRIEDPSQLREGEGCRVYYALYPLDQPPCEGCPIEYEGFRSFGREAVTGDVFSFKVPAVRRGSIYFFEARVIGADGSPGPASNRVRVEAP